MASWSIGPKPVGRNGVFTIRPKYYDKAENQRGEMKIRPFITMIKRCEIYSNYQLLAVVLLSD